MPLFNAKLSYGFENEAGDASGYGGLDANGRVNFKNDFRTNARNELLQHFSAQQLADWADFQITIANPNGSLSDQEVETVVQSKFDTEGGAGQPFGLSPNVNAGDTMFRGVRYIYIDGERWCQHTYEFLKSGAAWNITAQNVTETVILSFDWKVGA